MTALDMLKQDHKEVKGFFHQFHKAGERAFQQNQRIAEKTFETLEVHVALAGTVPSGPTLPRLTPSQCPFRAPWAVLPR